MSFDSIIAFFEHIPTDWIILFAVTVFLAFDALRSGQARVKALALSLPISLVCYTGLAKTAYLGPVISQLSMPFAQSVIALGIIVLVFLITLKATNTWGQGSQQPVSALMSGIAAAIVLLVVWLQVPPLQDLWHFGPTVQAIFGTSLSLYWMLAAFLAFAFVRN
jgi:hypothetical protein